MENLIKPKGLSLQQVVLLGQRIYKAGSYKTQPLMLHGPPGVGKTDCCRQLSEAIFQDLYGCLPKRTCRSIATGEDQEPESFVLERDGKTFLSIFVSSPLLDPTDIKGIPVIDHEEKLARWLKPFFLPTSGPGLILIDDLTAAAPSVGASLLSLIQHRRVLEYVLPPNVMIIAAGNRAEDHADSHPLSSALNSRMTHIQFVPSFEEWKIWAMQNNIHPSVIAFLRWRGGSAWFHSKQADLAEESFACPRTWHYASNMLHLDLPEEILGEVIAGCVGSPAATEYLAYRKLYQSLPEIKDILENPLKAPLPTTPDSLLAITVVLASLAVDQKNLKSIIDYGYRLGSDYQMKLFIDVVRVNMDVLLIGDKMPDGKMKYGQYLSQFVNKLNRLYDHAE